MDNAEGIVIMKNMNDEIIFLLKEIRDLQKLSTENQKKSLEEVENGTKQYESAVKEQKLYRKNRNILMIIFIVSLLVINFIYYFH